MVDLKSEWSFDREYSQEFIHTFLINAIFVVENIFIPV